VVHFGQVVILGCQPENGNGVNAAASQLASDVDGGQRLIDAKRGPAEQSNLLPGNHGHGAAGETL
jgi:hypothetical protein